MPPLHGSGIFDSVDSFPPLTLPKALIYKKKERKKRIKVHNKNYPLTAACPIDGDSKSHVALPMVIRLPSVTYRLILQRASHLSPCEGTGSQVADKLKARGLPHSLSQRHPLLSFSVSSSFVAHSLPSLFVSFYLNRFLVL